ncbi:hypothetical protein K227x_13350 [Rubripirellula lacrimiformis]|uniref:Uncharacterized protein n=1 Tax=Rubripirellula lacrimiformis TaxID=1930273 RepID=A0A517N737_9BACT|nr:hypothetical protein [Rubripirellula lacrimiformis]QDT02956.1 hypothetical protein K227x_13350 [Rubripirellula lacrimiformis]
MEDLQPPEIPPRQEVRICLSAFRDAHVILPRLSGRARLRRQALKLQWWESSDGQVLDVEVRRIGETAFWELLVDEGYAVAAGYRVIFTQAEPTQAIWILSVMTLNEPLTDFLIEILQMRLNVVLERMHISRANPFGLPN